ncbi:MAG: ABC transporter substrate-binding protein [Hydrogenophaga sp.]|jgi:ABC-type branched-subunit amino acid transport system substrate-binding protein|nr:ABC transporter substrate-binding protein [Hydrogenophaga sp.]MDP2220614.1 ABC transporter substrate-binding protein [Hydrogenophaga sp.]MDP3923832.1 ABC transporter substrate-binding protein [Hydrogenophaga sp.]MDZ4240008.1 ABC transporter substrate-binding protein [Hydrogenophaga sp.]
MTRFGYCARCLVLLLAVALLPAASFAQPIVLAHIGPFTGPAANDARDLNAGMLAYLSQVNARGGVAGRKLELVTLDDHYDRAEFSKQFAEAQARGAVALLSPLGLNAMRALLEDQLLERSDMVVVNSLPGATPFRSPGHPRLFHIRASDRQQIEKILLQASVIGVRRMTVLVQDLRAGEADVRGAQDVRSETRGLELSIQEMPENPAALATLAQNIAASDAQAVLVIGSPPRMAGTVAVLRKSGVRSHIYALSYLSPDLLSKVAGPETARGVAIAQTYPNPMGRTLPLHREFQATMLDFAPKLTAYSAFHLEGYLSARMAVEGLRRTSGPLRAEALADTFRRQGPVNLGGFHVDFSRGNAGSGHVDIGVIDARGRLIY